MAVVPRARAAYNVPLTRVGDDHYESAMGRSRRAVRWPVLLTWPVLLLGHICVLPTHGHTEPQHGMAGGTPADDEPDDMSRGASYESLQAPSHGAGAPVFS